MGDRRAELRDIITAGYEESRALIERLTEADLAQRTDTGWTVAQTAGHIARSPGGDVFVAKRLSAGKNATLPRFLWFAIDIRNYLGVRGYKTAARGDLLREFEGGHNKLFGFVNELTDEDLDRAGTVLGRGRMTAYEYLRQSPAHANEHADGIRRAIGG